MSLLNQQLLQQQQNEQTVDGSEEEAVVAAAAAAAAAAQALGKGGRLAADGKKLQGRGRPRGAGEVLQSNEKSTR